MRYDKLTLSALILLLGSSSAYAQGKPKEPPANDSLLPVELTITMNDGKPACSPAELRLPADSNVELRISSTATSPVVLTMDGDQFGNSRVLHHSGDLGHAMSNNAFTVKQNGKGMIRLRTLPASEANYGCTSINNQSDPFKGKVIFGKAG